MNDAGGVGHKMNADLDGLVAIQKIDTEIARKARLADKILPEEIEKIREDHSNAETKLENFKKQLQEDNKRRRDLESAVDETKNSIAKAKQKLPEVKTNVEYRAILKELDNFEKKIVAMEDEQIELMETIEEKSSEKERLVKEAAAEEEKFNAIRAEKEDGIKSLKSRIAELQKQRESILNGITPSILVNYEKISKQRNGVGVTTVADGSCQGCYQLITPQLYYLVRTSEKIFQCPHCDRYLYYIPEEEKSG